MQTWLSSNIRRWGLGNGVSILGVFISLADEQCVEVLFVLLRELVPSGLASGVEPRQITTKPISGEEVTAIGGRLGLAEQVERALLGPAPSDRSTRAGDPACNHGATILRTPVVEPRPELLKPCLFSYTFMIDTETDVHY